MTDLKDESAKMTPADHAKKLANWIRHECKKDHPKLDEVIAAGLKDGSKMAKALKDKCGIEHSDLQIAIDNTIKVIG